MEILIAFLADRRMGKGEFNFYFRFFGIKRQSFHISKYEWKFKLEAER